jgi:hypothetical protein
MKTRVRLAALVMICGALTFCRDPTPPLPIPNVYGTWAGPGGDDAGPGYSVLQLNQRADTVTGLVSVTDSTLGVTFPAVLVGRVSDTSTFSGTVAHDFNHCGVTVTFVAQVTPSGLVGTYSGVSHCTSNGRVSNGHFRLARQAEVLGVVLEPSREVIQVGHTVQLTATVIGRDQRPIPGVYTAWSSSNGAIATVSPIGRVEGVAGPGGAGITATMTLEDVDRAGFFPETVSAAITVLREITGTWAGLGNAPPTGALARLRWYSMTQVGDSVFGFFEFQAINPPPLAVNGTVLGKIRSVDPARSALQITGTMTVTASTCPLTLTFTARYDGELNGEWTFDDGCGSTGSGSFASMRQE